jgi:Na+/proline symporter
MSNPLAIETPPLEQYQGQDSFFGGSPPLPVWVGYVVVLAFGFGFSIFTTCLVYLDRLLTGASKITSEHFNTAGRMVKTGLTASVIVSQWTWAATLLQSSNVAWKYGISGPFWYASGATIQILLFGVLAISLKMVAPSAHTMCEIVRARWGKAAHITFLIFAFMANIIVTAMLLLGGAATVEALTGMDYRLASFLIPWGVIAYTVAGGLHATFLASYIHTVIIFGVLVAMILIVYIKEYSSDIIYYFLDNNISFTTEECEVIYSTDQSVETTFYEPQKYSCGPIPGNAEGSYLTFLSSGGLMFGIINIIGNFGTVFVDQSYWQSAIAARPESAAKGYLLGGLCWFAIPFALATSLGLASTALMLPMFLASAAVVSAQFAPVTAARPVGAPMVTPYVTSFGGPMVTRAPMSAPMVRAAPAPRMGGFGGGLGSILPLLLLSKNDDSGDKKNDDLLLILLLSGGLMGDSSTGGAAGGIGSILPYILLMDDDNNDNKKKDDDLLLILLLSGGMGGMGGAAGGAAGGLGGILPLLLLSKNDDDSKDAKKNDDLLLILLLSGSMGGGMGMGF